MKLFLFCAENCGRCIEGEIHAKLVSDLSALHFSSKVIVGLWRKTKRRAKRKGYFHCLRACKKFPKALDDESAAAAVADSEGNISQHWGVYVYVYVYVCMCVCVRVCIVCACITDFKKTLLDLVPAKKLKEVGVQLAPDDKVSQIFLTF